MKCYCYEKDNKFVWCVENAPQDDFNSRGFEKVGDKYFREYPLKEFHWAEDKRIIAKNFARLGASYFLCKGDWKIAMATFAQKCKANNLKWYTTGSISEALMGVDIKPGDIDIIAHTSDFFKMREIFSAYTIEPFVDNKGNWILRYFARLCIDGCQIEIAADESRNEENHLYEPITWQSYDLKVEPLKERYAIEVQRNRQDRVDAIKKYMQQNGLSEKY